MTQIFNHLRDREAQKAVAAVATGLHYFSGHIGYSYHDAVAKKAYGRQILGDGGQHGWNALKGAWYDGIPLPGANIHFLPGTTPQTGDASWFADDTAHPGFVIADFLTPDGLEITSISESAPPSGFRAIAETLKFPDWDASGSVIGFGYTTNPARQWMGLATWFGKLRNTRPNWTSWCAWRDFLGGLESVDYSTIPNEPGSGITASFYNGQNFNTFVQKRIDPGVNIGPTNGAPAYGVNTDEFSARFEGKIKFNYAEQYTLSIEHNDGVRLTFNGAFVIDEWDSSGTHTYVFNAALNTFYDIEIEWMDVTGDATLIFRWQSASQPLQVVPTTALYPKPEMQPRYEGHHEFDAPFDCDTALKTIEKYCNSFTQEADGQIYFYCLDNLAPVFTFDESNIDLATFLPSVRDMRYTDLQNRFEARFRDIYSQYLDFNKTPVVADIADLQTLAGRVIEAAPLEFPNMSRWQARKILNRIAKSSVINDKLCSFTGTALTWKVLPGDLVNINIARAGVNWVNKVFQTLRAVDNNDKLMTKNFDFQEWS